MLFPRRRDEALDEVAPGIYSARRTWGSNIYFLAGDGLVLVDSGFPLDAGMVKRACASLDPRGPGLMVATHCHLDHMGSMARIKEAFGSLVAAHPDDADVIEGKKPYTMFKLDLLRAVYYKALRPLYPYEYVHVDVRVRGGETLDALGGLRVIHLPGHTDGSIALYHEDTGALFTGDTIRNEDEILDGPPPRFTPDVELAYEGIRRFVLPLDFDVLLPGHGEVIRSGARERVAALLEERRKGEP